MYNMLIVEDNVEQSHILINTISERIPEIRFCNIAEKGKDAINIIKNQSADIILLDLKLADNVSGVDIIDFIQSKRISKYTRSIIVVTGELDLLHKIIKNPYVFCYSEKNKGIDDIISNVKLLLKEKNDDRKENEIKEKIKNELEKLNFNFSYNGTKYLLESIYEIYLMNDIENINLKSNIFPIIARKYKTNVNNVKTNVTQSYIRMYFDCSEKYLEKYLHLYIGTKKPKLRDIIVEILKRIK